MAIKRVRTQGERQISNVPQLVFRTLPPVGLVGIGRDHGGKLRSVLRRVFRAAGSWPYTPMMWTLPPGSSRVTPSAPRCAPDRQ